MGDSLSNRSAAFATDALQDMAEATLAGFVDRAAAQGWTTAQVLDAIECTVTRLRLADIEDPDPAENRVDPKPMDSVEIDEPSNDWPAG